MKNLEDWDYIEKDDLPESARQLAEIIGFEGTVALMKEFPLTGVYVTKPEEIHDTLIGRLLDTDQAEKLARFYQGETLVLYSDLALTRGRNRRIRLRGKHALKTAKSRTKYYAEIALQEGLSVATIRKIIFSY